LQVLDWQVIVEKHGQVVWQTAYRLLGNHADAADCFQETFLAALQVAQRQRVRSFPALLTRLATTRAIDRLRQRARQLRCHAELDPAKRLPECDIPSDNPGPAKQAQVQELACQLREAIAQLPPPEAKAFCLRYLDDMSYRRIAKELDIKTGTAGVLLHRAKAKLRHSLQLAPAETNEVA